MRFTAPILALLFSTFINAQEIEPIQADRPDQTETPAIVPKGKFQIETGCSFERNSSRSKSFAAPSVLWKYGVNDNFELRLITEFISEKNNNIKTSGLSPVLIGCKIKICDENEIVPKTSFIGHLQFPNLTSSKYKAEFYAPQYRFTMQHSLTNKLSLSYNVGSEWDGFSAEPTFIYTLSTGLSINKKLGAYAEIFGFAPQQSAAEHNFDGGFTYLLNHNFMVDLSGGVGITDNAPDYYAATGFSFRM